MSTTIPDSHLDLVKPGGFGALATLNADGYPQVTAVSCFIDDDGKLKLSINSSRHKLKNLRARPECTLLALDPQNTSRTLEIRARATVVADEDRSVVKRLLAAVGAPDMDLDAIDGPGVTRYVVILEPTKVNTSG
jgi:PPOX class probable F420-dependent enzyme